MAYHRQQGVDTCIARIFNTYGPRMRANDGRAVPTFIRQALSGRAADGVRRRLADAVVLLRRRPHRGPLPARRPRRARAGEPRQSRTSTRSRSWPRWCSRSRGAPARSSTRRCRPTTPRSASRTSRARPSCSAGLPGAAPRRDGPHRRVRAATMDHGLWTPLRGRNWGRDLARARIRLARVVSRLRWAFRPGPSRRPIPFARFPEVTYRLAIMRHTPRNHRVPPARVEHYAFPEHYPPEFRRDKAYDHATSTICVTSYWARNRACAGFRTAQSFKRASGAS